MIESVINRNKNYDIAFYTKSTTINNGITSAPTYTLYKTVKGLFWYATGNKNNVSEKYKEQVDGVIVVNPSDIALSEIESDMKIYVTNVEYFALIYADDIAGQNKVLQLNVKKWQ